MFWSAQDVTPENLAAVNQSDATHVLGFNEPDMAGQSNMTHENCLESWPQLMTLRQRLGSPAPADATWLEKFMPEAKRRGLRVDFVCLHRYPDISNPGAVDEVEALIEDARREIRAADLDHRKRSGGCKRVAPAPARRANPEMARVFLTKLLAMLERKTCVERYTLFADRVGNEYRLGSIFDPVMSRLTAMGKIFRYAV